MAQSTQPIKDVAIIGAGPAGLCLAGILGEYGFSVDVIEFHKEADLFGPHFDKRTTALSYASQNMLNAMNLWQDLAPHAAAIKDIQIYEGKIGKQPSSTFLHFDHQAIDANQPMGHVVHNQELRKAFYHKARAFDHVQFHFEQAWQHISTEPYHIDIHTQNKQLRAKVLIGADGGFSKVRQYFNIPTLHQSYKQTALVFNITHKWNHEHIAIEKFLPQGPLALLPLYSADPNIYRSTVIWTVPNAMAEDLKQAPLTLQQELFSQRILEFGDAFTIEPGISYYPLKLIIAKRLIDTRLALIADAAHCLHPIAGQGFNLGLRDIAALAEVFFEQAKLGQDIGNHTTLESYQTWRRFDTYTMGLMTDQLNKFFLKQNPVLKAIRTLGIKTTEHLPPLKHFFMREAMGLVGKQPKLLMGQPL